MKKSELVAPVFRNRLKFLMKLCILLLLISLGSGAINCLVAQQPKTRVITGIVTDAKGEPVIGASVVVKGTNIGLNTDISGKFQISVPVDSKSLIVSFIGMKKQEIDVSGIASVTVHLEDETNILDEVVVIGYGTQKKISVTSAIVSVKADQIIKSPVSSINNALAGRASGVITVQSTSEPGKDYAAIFIRGRATTGNTAPLILVDGIERDITLLDPNEVESINILKDASATAVYGVRGANGVIIVTTKVGRVGKPEISFTSNYGLQTYANIPRLLPAPEYMKMYNQKSYADAVDKTSWIPTFSGEQIEGWRAGTDPVFRKDQNVWDIMLTKWVPETQQNLNISGGTQKARYFVSLGHQYAEGFWAKGELLPGWDFNSKQHRYNIRANTDFQWTKKFSTSVKFATQIASYEGSGQTNVNALLNNLGLGPLNGPPYVDGKLVRFVDELSVYGGTQTPWVQLYNGGMLTTYSSRTNIDLTSKYDLSSVTKGLSVRGKFAYDNYYQQKVNSTQAYPQYKIVRTAPGDGPDNYGFVQLQYWGPWSADETFSQNARLYGEGALDYNRTFSGGHAITGLFLGTMERTFKGGTPALPYNYMGLVARVTYNYKEKYMTDVNMGYNGSENFAKGNQFGFFPSFSLGYVISEEGFFPKNNIFTFLKFRGSYGLVGNDNIGARFAFTPDSYTLSTNQYWFGRDTYTNYSGYAEAAIGNPLISWEVSKKSNLAVDLKFFNDQLSISAELFKENRDGIYSKYNNVSYIFGDISKLPSFNLGQVENKGYELNFEFRPSTNLPFRYFIEGNYSFARNKRTFFDEIPPLYPNLAQTGYPIDQPYGLIVEGFYTSWDEINDPARIKSIWEPTYPIQPGDYKYRDVNGDGVIDTNDRAPLGYTSVPEIFFGLTTGFSYNNWDVTVLVQGAAHVEDQLYGEFVGMKGLGKSINDQIYRQWTMEKYLSGDNIRFYRMTLESSNTHDSQGNSAFVEDMSYVRLKNIEIGYTLPVSFAKKLRMKSFRINVSGQNLLTASRQYAWDAESARGAGANARGKYPISHIFNIGVRANF